MEISVVSANGIAVIRLKGRFDFNTHRNFRAGIETALQEPHTRKVEVDLGGVDYLDSSALGMLLILRDKAQATNKAVELTNVRNSVAQVLEIANFKNMFAIS